MAVQCPKCGSNQTSRHKVGTTAIGTPRIVLTCLECGQQWSPGQKAVSAGSGGCGCLVLIVLVIAAVSVCNRTPQPPVREVPAINAPATHSSVPVTASSARPTVAPLKSAPVEPKPAASTKLQSITARPDKTDEPPDNKSPEEAARDKYGYLVKQAKELIKSNLNSAARTKLQRVIDGAPGTEVAKEAKELLDTIPSQ